MPTYRNPRTGEEVSQPSDGLTEFYLSHGWVLVKEATGSAPKPDNDDEPPTNLEELLGDLSGDESAKGKGKR